MIDDGSKAPAIKVNDSVASRNSTTSAGRASSTASSAPLTDPMLAGNLAVVRGYVNTCTSTGAASS
jgi:S-adenosylhomocysteine hydrolase